jgi:hypothetical protein
MRTNNQLKGENMMTIKGENMMKISRMALSFCFLLILASGALAQKVNVDFDKGTDFSKYKTYSWATGTPATNPMVHQRIVAGIEAQLAAKGFRKVESNPDIVVVYHTATDTQVSVSTWGGGPLGGWRAGMGSATVNKIPVGQLMVDIGDVNAKRFIWRGTASGTMSSKQEKNEKNLNTALAKMFQNFPQPPK